MGYFLYVKISHSTIEYREGMGQILPLKHRRKDVARFVKMDDGSAFTLFWQGLGGAGKGAQ